jgi:glutathione S-transferase
MLILHNYWSSVCSQKVRLVLAEKHLAYENRHVNLFEFEHWRPDYVKLNPKGVVPTLDHDGHIVIESNVIIEYLEEAFPPVKLRPDDPFARAQMRIWIFNSEEMAHPYVNTASHNPRHAARLAKKTYSPAELWAIAAHCPNPIIAARFLHRQEHGVSDDEENAAYEALDYLLDQMEEALAPGPWLVGTDYSLADIAMAPYINRIEVLKRPEMLSAARRPRIADWWQRMQARPAFKEAFSVANPDKSDPVQR